MYLKKVSFLVTPLVTSAFCLALSSCGSAPKADQDANASPKDSVAAVKTDAQTEDKPSFTLPSPLQIASIFKKAGLLYYPNIANAPENVSKYNSGKISQALNLGIYSADLSYSALNKQNQESKSYMKASRELASQLGLSKVFETDNLAERFEKNLSVDDSLASIIAEMQMQTDLILEEHEQEYISATVFAGAWVESMYIGGKVYEKGKAKNVSFRLVEQMAIAENIIKALKSYEAKDASITPVIADLTTTREIFKNFAGVKAMANSQEDIDFSKITITEDEIGQLIKKIDEIRARIIKG